HPALPPSRATVGERVRVPAMPTRSGPARRFLGHGPRLPEPYHDHHCRAGSPPSGSQHALGSGGALPGCPSWDLQPLGGERHVGHLLPPPNGRRRCWHWTCLTVLSPVPCADG